MASRDAADRADSEHTLIVTRLFDAPPEAVFKAWIEPAQIARWIGPRSVKAEVEEMHARVGGGYRIAMHHDSGKINIVSGTYREIAPPTRLVFTWAWEDEAETHKRGHESIVTLTFRMVGKQTEMTLRQERLETPESIESHRHGWIGSFDKLAEVLAGKPGRR